MGPPAPLPKRSMFEQRLQELALEELALKVRAARAIAEREELTREFVYEMFCREGGKEAALRALQRLKIELPQMIRMRQEGETEKPDT